MGVALEVFGWIGSLILVVSLLQTRILRLRLINLVGCIILMIYNAALAVWPMVGLNVALGLINVFYLIRLTRSSEDDATYRVVQVDPDDKFLDHVVTRYRDDLARFHPSFDGTVRAEQLAFIVQSGDETAGLMLISDAGEGVAQIDVDYVAPKFRDFSPGKFVFNHSRVFRDRGYTQILTPPDMVNPYYSRIGFQEVGDRYVKYLTG